MILTPRELKYFVNYTKTPGVQFTDSLYNRQMKDVITMTFCKERRFLPDKEWNRVIEFKRKRDISDDEKFINFTMSSDFKELDEQLSKIVKQQIFIVSKEQYEAAKKACPEMFI